VLWYPTQAKTGLEWGTHAFVAGEATLVILLPTRRRESIVPAARPTARRGDRRAATTTPSVW
jgi:hypothetical protein